MTSTVVVSRTGSNSVLFRFFRATAIRNTNWKIIVTEKRSQQIGKNDPIVIAYTATKIEWKIMKLQSIKPNSFPNSEQLEI